MRDDARPYLADRAVGLIVTAYGWQASVTTLTALRSIVHALRGWVTPYGAGINSSECRFVDGVCDRPHVTEQLNTVGHEVVRFARLVAAERASAPVSSPRTATATTARSTS
jgi:FMN reductase